MAASLTATARATALGPAGVRSREVRALVAALGFAGLGWTVLRLGFAPFELRVAWLTVLAGWTVASCGLVTWLSARDSRVGLLLVGAAAAQGIGIVVGSLGAGRADPGSIGAVLGWAMLVHAIVTAPPGRAADAPTMAVVAGAYAALLLPPSIALQVQACLVIGGVLLAAARGRHPGSSTAAAAIVVLVAFLPPEVVPGAAGDARILAAVGSATIAVLLANRVVAEAARTRRILDAAVMLEADVDGQRWSTRASLDSLLGGARLRIGYWRPDEGRFVDAAGDEVAAPVDEVAVTGGTRWTRLSHAGTVVALVEHPPGALADPTARDALARAASLVVAHEQLQAAVAGQRAEVRRSRARLIAAVDDEDRQLRTELEDRVAPRLTSLEAVLEALPDDDAARGGGRPGGDPLAHVRAARDDIARILAGLPPRALHRDGLGAALQGLAERSPLPVRVELASDGPEGDASRAALYFTCSEGLTNAIRHARASAVVIRLDGTQEACSLLVADDGVGGAASREGTGLTGIRDRLEAVGGRLVIESEAGRGTRLVATVPRTDAPPS